MAAERKQSEMTTHSEENKGVNCGGILTNDFNSPTKKNENSPSNSGPPSNKQISEFSQNAQSSPGKPSVAEVDQTLSTIMHQSPPMTISSAHVNNVDSIANESSSPTNTVMQQPGTKKRANLRKSSKGPAPYDDFIDNIYNSQSEPDESRSKCLVCSNSFVAYKARYHLVTVHPEVFFAHIKSRLSSPEAIDEFIARCGAVLQDEIDYAKKKTAEENPQQKAISCTYCKDEYFYGRYLKYHMLRYHFDVLEKKLISSYTGSETGRKRKVSNKILKTKSKSRVKRDSNLETGHQPNFDRNTTCFAIAAPTDWGRKDDDFHYENLNETLGISQNAHSTGHQADVEIDYNLPTIIHQRSPFKTSGLYANNVGNETSSQTKAVVQQHVTQPVNGGICSKAASTTHREFMFEIFKRHSELVNHTNPPLIKCLICGQICIEHNICYHLVSDHPEIFFVHVKSQFMDESTPDTTTHFSELCKFALRKEIHLAVEKLAGHARENMYNITLPCTYCSNVHLDEGRLKFHIFRIHYNAFEEKLIACCQNSELERGGKASETILTTYIQQYHPAIVSPGNSQYFYPPVPLHEQQQMKINQEEISASHSSQHPSCSTGITNDATALPEWVEDLEQIFAESSQEEHFDFNEWLNPPYNNTYA